jgi:N-acetylglucosamine-6-sulfatase
LPHSKHRQACLQRALAFICLLALVATVPATANADERPNILFILTDDLRFDALGVNGHPWAQTPNIDRIANEGVNFLRAYTVSPLCSVSRASFLTGQYPHRHGWRDNANPPHDGSELLTFPMLLSRAGYETGFIGKWHFGRTDPYPRPGFDYWAGWKSQGRYTDPVFGLNGHRTQLTGHSADVVTGLAVDFIRQPHEQAFMLFISYKSVHSPTEPAPRHAAAYSDQRPNGKERQQQRTLLAVDEGVGRLLAALSESGQLDQTLVVFSSDSGKRLRDDPERPVFAGDKRGPYDLSALRVPLLLRYPNRIEAGTRLESLAANIDLMPTLLELAGVTVPPGVQGQSLWQALDGDTSDRRSLLLAEYWGDEQPNRTMVQPWRAVISDRYKLVSRFGQSPDELYDLIADPNETQNIAAREPEILKRLREQMEKLAQEAAESPAVVAPPQPRAGYFGEPVAESEFVLKSDENSRSDPPLSYHWQKIAGPRLRNGIQDPGSAQPTVRLTKPGAYRFRLIAWNDQASATTELLIEAADNETSKGAPQ